MYFPTVALGARVRAVVNIQDRTTGTTVPAGEKGTFRELHPDGSGQLGGVWFDHSGPALVTEDEIEVVKGEEN